MGAGRKQQELADALGWSRDKVAKFAALKSVHQQAWEVIVTTIQQAGTIDEEGSVTQNVTTVTFTEGLLRSILDLTPEQQLELVRDLAAG